MQYDYGELIVMCSCSFFCLFYPGSGLAWAFRLVILWALCTYFANRYIYLAVSKETYYTSCALDVAATKMWGVPLGILAFCSVCWLCTAYCSGGNFGLHASRVLEAEERCTQGLYGGFAQQMALATLAGAAVVAAYLLLLRYLVRIDDTVRDKRDATRETQPYEETEKMYRFNWWNVNPIYVLKANHGCLEGLPPKPGPCGGAAFGSPAAGRPRRSDAAARRS